VTTADVVEKSTKRKRARELRDVLFLRAAFTSPPSVCATRPSSKGWRSLHTRYRPERLSFRPGSIQ